MTERLWFWLSKHFDRLIWNAKSKCLMLLSHSFELSNMTETENEGGKQCWVSVICWGPLISEFSSLQDWYLNCIKFTENHVPTWTSKIWSLSASIYDKNTDKKNKPKKSGELEFAIKLWRSQTGKNELKWCFIIGIQ